MIKNQRPTWERYFIKLAHIVKERSNCRDMTVGVVVVKDKRIIATGYNGTPIGVANCFDGGCIRCLKREKNELKTGERKDLCICVHAEENALLQSAYHGVATKDAVMYSTHSPCSWCARAIINAGVRLFVYEAEYSEEGGRDLLRMAGVEVVQITI